MMDRNIGKFMFSLLVVLWTLLNQSEGLVENNLPLKRSKPSKGFFPTESEDKGVSRRGILFQSLAAGLLVLGNGDDAFAFENKISTQYDDRPKRRGAKPADLGVATRKDIVGEEYQGLKHCGGAPNCFCSTDDIEDDPDHNIPSWIWPKEFGSDKEKAFEQLAEMISAYEPGQNNIDGGGFKIIKNDPTRGYIYTQFESLKNGYVDDVEIAFIDGMGERSVQVRSSSRIGYLDFGVNGKRLNYIAKALQGKGWTAEGVNFATHQNYAIQNELE